MAHFFIPSIALAVYCGNKQIPFEAVTRVGGNSKGHYETADQGEIDCLRANPLVKEMTDSEYSDWIQKKKSRGFRASLIRSSHSLTSAPSKPTRVVKPAGEADSPSLKADEPAPEKSEPVLLTQEQAIQIGEAEPPERIAQKKRRTRRKK